MHIAIALLLTLTALTACGKEPVTNVSSPAPTTTVVSGTSTCHVHQTSYGALITCDDGTSASILNGTTVVDADDDDKGHCDKKDKH